MTVFRLLAIFFIFVCVTVAWLTLAGITLARTAQVGTQLNPQVQELWGPPLTQTAPTASFTTLDRPWATRPLPLDASDLNVGLHLEHRQKGLLWFSTYTVDFDGKYRFVNALNEPISTTVQYAFPAADTLYDNFKFQVNGAEVLPEGDLARGLTHTLTLGAQQAADVRVTYRSRGIDSWLYRFGPGITDVKNFTLTANTDFRDVDFPQQTISSTTKQATPEGWLLQWHFDSLVAGFQIGVKMPEKTQPGPLASRMSLFAPISLLFFFTVLVILGAVRGQNLHPMHFFFLGAAFFAFHLLFTYLADQVPVEWAFGIAALASLVLVVTYVGRVSSWKFALREVGIAQLIFLILFSYAFFFEGYTGLVITLGAIATLAILMQVTAKVNWDVVFKGKKPPVPNEPLSH